MRKRIENKNYEVYVYQRNEPEFAIKCIFIDLKDFCKFVDNIFSSKLNDDLVFEIRKAK